MQPSDKFAENCSGKQEATATSGFPHHDEDRDRNLSPKSVLIGPESAAGCSWQWIRCEGETESGDPHVPEEPADYRQMTKQLQREQDRGLDMLDEIITRQKGFSQRDREPDRCAE